MTDPDFHRRGFLGMLAAAAVTQGVHGAEDEVIAFSDTPAFNAAAPRLPWNLSTSWATPDEHMFWVSHYGYPDVNAASWKLDVSGLVSKPFSLTLDELKARPKKEQTLLIECAGNGPAGGLVGNTKWAGTPLASILKSAALKPEATDVVFFGADSGTEKIGTGEYKQNFARFLPLRDAMRSDILVGYEMNGKPLTKEHGAPVRLIVPGWYGVAWVKWLTRIEVHDRPYQARFTARDYVTLRGEPRGADTIWRETLVGRMNLKSVPARVTKRPNGSYVVTGAAWSDGTAIRSVEVKIDDGPWQAAQPVANKTPHTWTFWSYEWSGAKPGEHSITSRATDVNGRVQPQADDPSIAMKKTRWENNQQAVRKIKI